VGIRVTRIDVESSRAPRGDRPEAARPARVAVVLHVAGRGATSQIAARSARTRVPSDRGRDTHGGRPRGELARPDRRTPAETALSGA